MVNATKGCTIKNLTKWNLVFMISVLKTHQNLKILVSTLHNTLVNMWSREKNFVISMSIQLRILENKISLSEVFYGTPFNT